MEYRKDPPRSSGTTEAPAPHVMEEALVSDARAGLSPAEQVELKLVSLLHNVPLGGTRLPSGRVQRPRL
jgi:hypothetical protein